MVEVLSLAYAKQYSLDVVIARFAYVYGYTACKPNTAFYQFVDTALGGNDIVFRGAGFGRRDNIFIQDAVHGVMTIAEKGESSKIYNVSSGSDMNNFAAIDEMADLIATCVNELVEPDNKILVIMPKTATNSRVGGIILDNSKLKSLGWKIETNLEDGIKNIIKAYMY